MKKILQYTFIISAFILFCGPAIVRADRSWSPPDQTGHAGAFLGTDGTNPSWATILSSALAIGDAIGGSHANDVLFVDSSNNLGQDDNFTYNTSTGIANETIGGATLNLDGTTGTSTFLSYGVQQLSLSDNTGVQEIGDIGFGWFNDTIQINGPLQQTSIQENGNMFLLTDVANSIYQLGDISGYNNGTALTIDDGKGVSYFTNHIVGGMTNAYSTVSGGVLDINLDGNKTHFKAGHVGRIKDENWILYPGAEIVLINNLTSTYINNQVGAGGTHPILLAGSGNFVAPPNSRLTLMYDQEELVGQGAWVELARTTP